MRFKWKIDFRGSLQHKFKHILSLLTIFWQKHIFLQPLLSGLYLTRIKKKITHTQIPILRNDRYDIFFYFFYKILIFSSPELI